MSVTDAEPIAPAPLQALERWTTAAASRDRMFWIALAAAALLHAAFLIRIVTTAPRHLGDASGSDDGISISVVTEADLQSRSTVSEEPQPPPGPPVTATPPVPVAPPPQPEAKPVETTPEDKAVEAKPEPKVEPQKPETKVELAPSLAEDVPDLLTIPNPNAKPAQKTEPQKTKPEKTEQKSEPKPEQKQPPQKQRTAKLDLTPPPSAFDAPGGGGREAGGSRPPGITRSGANDDFGRKVIGELQKTMPQLRETLGRVLVRIILDQNANVASVEVLRPSNVAGLDQSVVFAVKQTSFPFPPPNATDVDRTFLVTYIYK
jgi:periplasmic protein TonB